MVKLRYLTAALGQQLQATYFSCFQASCCTPKVGNLLLPAATQVHYVHVSIPQFYLIVYYIGEEMGGGGVQAPPLLRVGG